MTKWQKLSTGNDVTNGTLREETYDYDNNEKVLESAINVKSCGPSVDKKKMKKL